MSRTKPGGPWFHTTEAGEYFNGLLANGVTWGVAVNLAVGLDYKILTVKKADCTARYFVFLVALLYGNPLWMTSMIKASRQ